MQECFAGGGADLAFCAGILCAEKITVDSGYGIDRTFHLK